MTDATGSPRVPRWRTSKVLRNAGIVGIIGLILSGIGVAIEPRQGLASYLFAYVAVLTLVLGALIQVMISHVTGARWFTVLRRLTLVVTGSLPMLALLLLPVLFGIHQLYPWALPADLPPEAQAIAAHRAAWFRIPFFVARAVIYVVIFTACGEALRRWAARENSANADTNADTSADTSIVAIVRRQRRLSALGLVLVGIALTLVAFDWLMPLDTEWYSTVYGVYVFAGGFVAALGLIACLALVSMRGHGALTGVATAEHFGALGKLMLTFVIFWGYIAFSQFLIIWIGDIPADSSWYVVRAAGSWGTLGLVIVIGQFAIPFVLLLSRALKRRPVVLAAIGLWLVAMHVLDVYWLVLPAFYKAGVHVHWLDFTTLMMVGGLTTFAAAWRASGHEALPMRDPYLAESVSYAEP